MADQLPPMMAVPIAKITGRCCGTCKHWRRGTPNGECHRFPPHLMFIGMGPQGPMFHSMFTVTAAQAECAEYAKKLEIAEASDIQGLKAVS